MYIIRNISFWMPLIDPFSIHAMCECEDGNIYYNFFLKIKLLQNGGCFLICLPIWLIGISKQNLRFEPD